jgi:hypothetical protein
MPERETRAAMSQETVGLSYRPADAFNRRNLAASPAERIEK